MTNDKLNKVFKDFIWKPEDLTKCVWTADCDELSYNSDGNIDDLMNTDGNTYSFMVEGEIEKDGVILFSLKDDFGGEPFQCYLSVDRKVDEEKYWDEYSADDLDLDEDE